jgi:hypothetical protein
MTRGIFHSMGGPPVRLVLAFTAIAFCGVGQTTAAAVGVDQRTPTTSAKAAEAGRHFHRGIELYDDGDLSAATVEFSRAYQIVPSFKILYNLGQIAYQRQDYVTARDAFRRYLADGGDQILTERKRQVEQDVRRLDQRIGRLEVETREDGSEVLLDGVTAGTTPLWAIAANVGRRRVEIVSKIGMRQVRLVDIVGGETTHVRFGAPVPSPLSTPREPTLSPKVEILATPPQSLLSQTQDARLERPSAPSSHGGWAAWSATGALALGAAVTGALAFSAARNLQEGRDTFPISAGSLDPYARRAKLLAWTSDGFLAGTVIMAAISSYLSFRGPSEAQAPKDKDDDRLGLNE